jgi:hypothetical protein
MNIKRFSLQLSVFHVMTVTENGVIFRFLEQGKLSNRATRNEFNKLTEDEISSIEKQFQSVFMEN